MDSKLTIKLNRARWWLLQNQPFYGTLGMTMPDVLGNPHGTTACTDGRRIFWAPEFLEKLTDEETRFVLMHETLHPAHEHFWRLGADSIAQQACDHEINLILQKITGAQMPKDGLADPRFRDMPCEKIAGILRREQSGQKPNPGNPGKPGNDPGGCGGYSVPDESGDDAPGKAGAGKTSLRDEWKQRVIQAAQSAAAQSAAAQGRGDIPGDMARLIERIQAVEIDWRAELADFVKTQIGVRNDWSRSARRMATAPCIYPRRRTDEMGLIVAVRDTSGSIGGDVLSEFTALIASAAAETNSSVILLDVDTQIQAETRLEPGELPSLTAPGGGGTDFACVAEKLAELRESGERISGVITMTDLEGSDFDAGETPSLFLCTTESVSAHGRTVRIHP